MENKIKYQFSAKLWKNNIEGSWHFVTVPDAISKEIRHHLKWQEEGWGRMKASVIIKEFHWNTSIWFDTKINNYILPIKGEIRSKAKIKEGSIVKIELLV